MKTAVCLYVRDEARDIAEWLAYHHVIGFDCCIVYDNGSEDGTSRVVEAAQSAQDVRLIDWPTTDGNGQISCYQHALDTFGREFDWMAFFDADEFLVLHRHRNVADFLGEHEARSAVAVNWAIFGSGGVTDWPDKLVIETFTKRATAAMSANRHYKTIANTRAVTRIVNSHAVEVAEGYVTPDGSVFADIKPGKMNAVPDYSVCQINHYFTGSLEHWKRKMHRGYRVELVRTMDDFRHHDRNDVDDLSAVAWAPAVYRQMALYRHG